MEGSVYDMCGDEQLTRCRQQALVRLHLWEEAEVNDWAWQTAHLPIVLKVPKRNCLVKGPGKQHASIFGPSHRGYRRTAPKPVP